MPAKMLLDHCSATSMINPPVSLPPLISPEFPTNVCAKMVTTRNGRREALVLNMGRPVTIGRNPTHCTYLIPDMVVSSIHCKLYAVRSSTGGNTVACQDLSTNGIILNGNKFRKSSVILMDGDTLQIPASQTFKCVHVAKVPQEKIHIFDPTPPTKPFEKSIGRYTVTSHCLGSGAFATVHLAIDKTKYRQVACKTIKTKKESDMHQFMKEVDILSGLNHPNINCVYGLESEGKFLHIFLQLCTGGDLFSYITNHTETSYRLCEGETKYIMFQILRALEYLHDKNISHRDLKPENLLLYDSGPYPHIQIADFGLARPRAYEETLNVRGTVCYLPPEGIKAMDNKDLGYVGMPADCWSAGVIMYIMLAGFNPFDCGRPDYSSRDSDAYSPSPMLPSASESLQASVNAENLVKHRIVRGELQFQEDPWNEVTEAKALVSRLLIYNPLDRATVYSALDSPWITCDLEELEYAYLHRIVGAGV